VNLKSVLESDRSQSILLTIVYFGEDTAPAMVAAVHSVVNTPNLKIEYIIEDLPFNRGKGLKLALEKSSASMANSLVWLTDVDMEFSSDFITRCKSTPTLNRQVIDGIQLKFKYIQSLLNLNIEHFNCYFGRFSSR